MSATEPRRDARWPVCLWGVVGTLACASMVPLEPNLLEEGFALHVAQRIASGERMYRDIVFFSGPVPFELLAVLFRALGDSVFVARGAVAALHGISAAIAFALARRAGAGRSSHAAAVCMAAAPILLFPLLSVYFHTTIAFHLVGIAVYAGVRATGSSPWAVAAGGLVSLVGLSKQSVGAALALGLVGAVVVATPRGGRWSRALGLGAGGLVVAVGVAAAFAARGDLRVFLHGILELPLTLGGSFRTPYINLWPPGELVGDARFNAPFYLPKLPLMLPEFQGLPGFVLISLAQLLFLLPWLALALTAALAIRTRLPAVLWIQAAGILALCVNLFPRSDWGHLVFALPPAAIQLVLLGALGRTGGAPPEWRRRTVAWLAGVVALLAVAGGARLWSLSRAPSLGPRVPLRPITEAAGSIEEAVRYLLEHAEPGTAIFVPRAEPLVYFATGTRNPTPFEGVVTGIREEQEQRILEGLDEVRYVVMSDVDQPFMTFYAEELPRIQTYLERHFQLAAGFRGDLSPVLVLERGPDRGPTLVDLLENWAFAGLWVRHADGSIGPWERLPPRLATRHNRRLLPIVLGAGGGGIDFQVVVPEHAVFQSDVGLRGATSPDGLHLHPRFAEMAVSVALPDAPFERLASIRVGTGPGRSWTPVEVDLARWAGQLVTLRLEVIAELLPEADALAWWGSPRIARRTDAP